MTLKQLVKEKYGARPSDTVEMFLKRAAAGGSGDAECLSFGADREALRRDNFDIMADLILAQHSVN